ncbi:MAG: hypothetical protein U1E96_10115 [Azonexus sp.]
MEAHLEGDFVAEAVGSVEGMAEGAAGEGRETLGKFHYRLVGEAGEHDVFEGFELSLRAALIRGWAWPKRLVHQELIPSR